MIVAVALSTIAGNIITKIAKLKTRACASFILPEEFSGVYLELVVPTTKVSSFSLINYLIGLLILTKRSYVGGDSLCILIQGKSVFGNLFAGENTLH